MKFLAPAVAASFLLMACQPSLNRQPKNDAFTETGVFANGAAARPLPRGVRPYPDLANHRSLSPLAELERGQERFNIHCSVCHGISGYGNGIASERGFNNMPSLHGHSALEISDVGLETLIRYGQGRMYGLGDRIPAADIHAIVAYVRALQLSQNAPVNYLLPAEREKLGPSR